MARLVASIARNLQPGWRVHCRAGDPRAVLPRALGALNGARPNVSVRVNKGRASGANLQ